jgi:hypothetical protein
MVDGDADVVHGDDPAAARGPVEHDHLGAGPEAELGQPPGLAGVQVGRIEDDPAAHRYLAERGGRSHATEAT